MDTGRDRQVTWISAPPGSGKTTLAASYLDARKLPCLWYQVDEGDADIATFFYYMRMAVEKVVPGKQKPLPLLTPEYLQSISIFTKRYFEELYCRLKPPFVIVFDNYQDVPVSSGFHDMIVHGLDVVPEGICIVVASRIDPPPQLARLCANNKCNHIGWDEIRFTPDEMSELVRMKMSSPSPTPPIKGEGESKGYAGSRRQKGIPDEILAQLYTRTEGWAAGLILMMESIRTKNVSLFGDRDKDYQLLNKLTPKEVFDYFASEAFTKIDEETKVFLLKTAFLPKTTASMAEILTSVSNSGQILFNLNQNNYFTAMHPRAEPVYQYHPLFREFLLSRAKASFNQEESFMIQRSAAALLEESGQVEAAAMLLRDMKDFDGLTQLILDKAPSLVAQGRTKTLEEWLVSIPGEVKEKTPWLMYWMGVCRLSYSPTESHRLLEKVFELFRIRGDRTGMLLSWASGLDAYFHEFEDFTPLDWYISVWEDFLEKETTFASMEIEIHIVSSRFILMLLRQMNHPEIVKWAERLFHLLRGCRDVNHRLQSGHHIAVYYLWTGDFAKAGILVDFLKKDVQSEAASPLYRLLGKTTHAMYAWLTGDIISCLRIVSEALKFAQETGVHVWDHHLLSHGTCASLSAGDTKTSVKLLQKIEQGLVHARKIDIGFYNFLTAWESLLCGNLPLAGERNKISLKALLEVDAPFPIAVDRYWEAQILFALGRHKEAEAQLNLVRQIGRWMKSKQVEYMCLLAEAQFALGIRTTNENADFRLQIADLKTHDTKPHTQNFISESSQSKIKNSKSEITDRGLDALRKAMELGREQGYVNMFGWRPDVMSRLCVKALEAGIEVRYVQNLVRKRQLVPDVPPLECENWLWPLKIFTLGQFVLLKEGESINFSGKVQRKPLELLKAVISLGGREVSEDQVTDILWPDAEGDMAHQTFDTTLHRLRRLLGNDMAIKRQGGQLTLDDKYCWVDIWAFERIVENIEDVFKRTGETEQEKNGKSLDTSPSGSLSPPFTISQTEVARLSGKIFSIYKGSFLPSDARYLWTVSTRERLRNKFSSLIVMMGDFLEQSGLWKDASGHYHTAIETDDLTEEFYQRLMVCYYQLDQYAKAIEVYQRLKATLSAHFGIKPSRTTEVLYKALISKNK